MNAPIPMSQDELVEVLTDILDRVRAGDSFEGSLEYLMPGSFSPDDPEDAYAMVRASYRVGNSLGQGGMRMVGKMTNWPDPQHAEIARLQAEVERLNVELVEGPLPVLLGWEAAPFDEECHWCRNGIADGARVAILSTAARVCESCANGQRRGAR